MSQQHEVGKHCTTVQVKDGVGRVTYHDTDVVTWDDTKIVLNTGGWFTATTKSRMNQASNQYDLGYHVVQRKGVWYVEYKDQIHEFEDWEMILKR